MTVVQQLGPSGLVKINADGSITLPGGDVTGGTGVVSPWDVADGTEFFNDDFDALSGWSYCYGGTMSDTWTPASPASINRGTGEAESVAEVTTRPGYLLVQAQNASAKAPVMYREIPTFDSTGNWTCVWRAAWINPVTISSNGILCRWGMSDPTATNVYLPDEGILIDSPRMNSSTGLTMYGFRIDLNAATTSFGPINYALRPYTRNQAWHMVTHASGSNDFVYRVSWDGLTWNRIGVITKTGTKVFTHMYFYWGTSSADDNYIYWLDYVRLYQSIKTR